MARCFIKALIPLVLLFNTGYCQISDSLYHALPSFLKPRNHVRATIKEKENILLHTTEFISEQFRAELHNIAMEVNNSSLVNRDIVQKVGGLNAVAAYNFDRVRVSDSILKYYKQLTDAAGSNTRFYKEVAYANIACGTIYSYDKLTFTKAANCYRDAETAWTGPPDSSFNYTLFSGYSHVFAMAGLPLKARQYLIKALAWLPHGRQWTEVAIQDKIGLGVNYLKLYDEINDEHYLDSAITSIQKTMYELRDVSPFWYQACYFFIGRALFKKKEYNKAITAFDSSMLPAYNHVSRYYGNNYYGVRWYKGMTLIKLKKYAAGKQLLDTVTPNAMVTVPALLDKSQALAEYALSENDYKSAYRYQLDVKRYADSLNASNQLSKIFDAEQQFTEARNEAALQKLNFEKLKTSSRNKRTVIISISVIIVLILSALLLYRRMKYRRLTERRQAQESIDKITAEMEMKTMMQQAEVQEAVNVVRKNISGNMHDSVSSSLSAVIFFTADLKQQASGTETKHMLTQVEEELRHTYIQARDLMHSLHAIYDRPDTVTFNVHELLIELQKRFADTISLRIDVMADYTGIDKYFTLVQHAELYMVLKEAVTNVLKHSNADVITITLSFINIQAGMQCAFNISDNGRPKSSNTNNKGIGLKNMYRRICEQLKGTLNIDHTANGTVIAGTFPVNFGLD